MNIFALKNLGLTTSFRSHLVNSKVISEPIAGLSMPAPLTVDTVTFKGKTKIADALEQQAIKENPRLERLATTFLDTLEAIAIKLKDDGVSFSRSYCEKNPVKSPKSYISKIKRSGSFNVPDRVRATLYVKNPYDLSILTEKILPELEKRGLVVAKTNGNLDELIAKGYVPNMKELSGKEVQVPDLDIRLNPEKLDTSKLGSKYQFCLGKPQKSGYEDIQMRLVREHDLKANPVQHELIVLMGENYAHAKHLESDMVYGVLRKFDELNITKKGNENIESFKNIKSCINLLKQTFNKEISQKLFDNAKKLDLTGEKNLSLIKLDEEKVKLINECLNELEKNINSYYRTAKASKRIADSTKKKIEIASKNDKLAISQIRQELKQTIDFFNERNYLKRKKEV